eukprot:COSAG05_NODE_14763_length_386_cov_1.746528_1_plen_26_part_10
MERGGKAGTAAFLDDVQNLDIHAVRA